MAKLLRKEGEMDEEMGKRNATDVNESVGRIFFFFLSLFAGLLLG